MLARTEDILKAARRAGERAEGEEPEAWAAPIETGFETAHHRIVAALADDAEAVLTEGVVKAHTQVNLTNEQINDLKMLVRQHYLAHVLPDARRAFWNVPDETRRRWEAWGIVGPVNLASGAGAGAAIDEMVVASRVAELLEHGTTYRRMRELAQERPQTRALEIARLVARQHAGHAIDRHGDRWGDRLRQSAFDAEQRYVLGDMLGRFLAGKLTRTGSTRELASALRRTLGSAEHERDWRRIAVSETRWAYNYGSLVHYLEEGWKRIVYVVQPTACDQCKKLLLNRDGSQKIFALDDIIENVAEDGGMNAGRSAGAIGKPGGWRPTALIHPWCRCRPVPYLGTL